MCSKTALIVLVCVLSVSANAKYGGGSGTAEDPYHIWTAEQMNSIGTEPNDWDKHFILMTDIDLGDYGGTSYNIIGYSSIMTGGRPFRGVFEGNHHKIKNFTYTAVGANEIGIFGYVGFYSLVQNLTLVDPNIDTGEACFVGSLVGRCSGEIVNCRVQGGTILGKSSVGGLVGTNCDPSCYCMITCRGGTITHCSVVETSVIGEDQVAGLVGANCGTLVDCYSTASVEGRSYIGGLVGCNDYKGILSTSFAEGNVQGREYLGGLVGYNTGEVSDCYSTANVDGHGYYTSCGGLVGENLGTVLNSYSIGHVQTKWDSPGGLVGSNERGIIRSSFWDIETSDMAASAGGMGRTTAEMQDPNTYVGWGHDGAWTINAGNDYPRLWWEDQPGELLDKRLSDFIAGNGEANNPYLIYTAEELNMIGLSHNEWDKCFKLMADIDLSGYKGTSFNIIGYYVANGCYDGMERDRSIGPVHRPFVGVFDGNGHTISNFTYTSSDASQIGLFGYSTGMLKHFLLIDTTIDAEDSDDVGSLVGLSDGTVHDCHVQDCWVVGAANVGGLVGLNGGRLEQCHSTGFVFGSDNVGGLIGKNGDHWGHIEDPYYSGYLGIVSASYSKAIVLGLSAVGGLVGWNDRIPGRDVTDQPSEADNCYSLGDVMGIDRVGGLAGENRGKVTSCYSASNVLGAKEVGGLIGTGIMAVPVYQEWESVSSSFWDTESSEQETSAGGVGKTAAEMCVSNGFADAGWDFVGEVANGTNDIWAICGGRDYPRLTWEFTIGDFDRDADTDFTDFCIFADFWLRPDGSFWCGEGCDLTNDGTVDYLDLKVLADNWMTGTEWSR